MTKRTMVPLSLYVTGYLIIVAFTGWGFYFARQQRDDLRAEVVARQEFDNRRAFDICEANNDQLKAIRDVFQKTTDALVKAAGPPNTPKDRAQVASYVAGAKAALAPLRDKKCSTNPKVPVDTVSPKES